MAHPMAKSAAWRSAAGSLTNEVVVHGRMHLSDGHEVTGCGTAMSYLIAAPEMLAATATEMAGIGSSLNAADAAASSAHHRGHGPRPG